MINTSAYTQYCNTYYHYIVKHTLRDGEKNFGVFRRTDKFLFLQSAYELPKLLCSLYNIIRRAVQHGHLYIGTYREQSGDEVLRSSLEFHKKKKKKSNKTIFEPHKRQIILFKHNNISVGGSMYSVHLQLLH